MKRNLRAKAPSLSGCVEQIPREAKTFISVLMNNEAMLFDEQDIHAEPDPISLYMSNSIYVNDIHLYIGAAS